MKMTRFAKIFFWFLVTVLVLWQLPWAIDYLTVKPANTPFTLYSEVLGDFAMIGHDDKEPLYLDRRGKHYTRREFDSLLPLFYARQLMTDGRFPDTVAGRPVTLREVQQASFIFRSTPKDLNRPSPGIHFLLESLSGRVDLTMPSDAFRLTERGVEFIDMASNRIDSAKSARFTATMRRKGVRFPVREIAGNPTARKEYDEGYVLLDADGRLFHLKMVQGRPYVRAVELPEGVRLRHLFITEFRSRRMGYALSNSASTAASGAVNSVQEPERRLGSSPGRTILYQPSCCSTVIPWDWAASLSAAALGRKQVSTRISRILQASRSAMREAS